MISPAQAGMTPRTHENYWKGKSAKFASPRIDPQAAHLTPVDGIDKSGLEFGFLSDLTLKTVYADSDCSTERAAERLRLPMSVVEPILQHLYKERLIEIRQLVGFENHRYSILDRGWDRVQRLLDQNGYIGPAPVSLDAYSTMIRKQQESAPGVTADSVRRALSGLVLPESTTQTLGVVANSRRSILITGRRERERQRSRRRFTRRCPVKSGFHTPSKSMGRSSRFSTLTAITRSILNRRNALTRDG